MEFKRGFIKAVKTTASALSVFAVVIVLAVALGWVIKSCQDAEEKKEQKAISEINKQRAPFYRLKSKADPVEDDSKTHHYLYFVKSVVNFVYETTPRFKDSPSDQRLYKVEVIVDLYAGFEVGQVYSAKEWPMIEVAHRLKPVKRNAEKPDKKGELK